MSTSESREKMIFCEAVDLPKDQLDSYLAQACGSDEALERRVRRLLRKLESTHRFLPQPDDPMGGEPIKACAQIDQYQIIHPIGEGGFGEVFLAVQAHPVKRQVALKVLKAGMDTKQVIGRFEAERQALARMSHPSIAKVLDAGLTESGKPYFVMEYVEGSPITKFCASRHLAIQDRLALFIQVCHAIQHAHQKGVIHRDIKPTNILVTDSANASGHPVVIDFGVAKAMDEPLTGQTLWTHASQLLGTPAYMSPEQASMSPQDIDTRSDVYSLGILLYELLIGTTPFPEQRFHKASPLDIQRVLCEEEPARPSVILRRLLSQAQDVSSLHPSNPQNLLKKLRGDLDWIALKAVEKDRDRRYGTAVELASDLKRYLEGEPIMARPPSQIYRLSKSIGKHKGAWIAATLVGLALVGGLLSTTQQARRARQAEIRMAAALNQADQEAREANRQREIANSINQWMTQLIDMSPWAAQSGENKRADLSMQEALMNAAARIDTQFVDQPEVEAHVRMIIGRALGVLDHPEKALFHLEKSWNLFHQHFGPSHTNTLEAQLYLAEEQAFYETKHSPSSGPSALQKPGMELLQEGFLTASNAYGWNHLMTLRLAGRLGNYSVMQWDLAQGEALLVPVVETLSRRGANLTKAEWDVLLLEKLSLSILRRRQGRDAEAHQLSREVVDEYELRRIESGHPENYLLREVTARAAYNQGLAWWEHDEEQAKAEMEKTLQHSRKLIGNAYPTDSILGRLTHLYLLSADFSSAFKFAQEWFDVRLPHPKYDTILASDGQFVASIPGRLGQWTSAVQELRRQRELGVVDVASMTQELLLSHLTEDTNSVAFLSQELRQHLEAEDIDSLTYDEKGLLLAMPSLGRDYFLDKLCQDAIAQTNPSWVRGIAVYRKGDWTKAVETLKPTWKRLDHSQRALFTAYFLSMATYRDGYEEEARHWLTLANESSDRLLASGNLGGQWQWPWLAACILIRREAEQLIFAREVPFVVTTESLRLARQTWEPVDELLRKADVEARSRKYTSAGGIYGSLLSDERFELSSAQHHEPNLSLRMAITFLHAKDHASYSNLCAMLAEEAHNSKQTPTHILALSPAHLMESQQRYLASEAEEARSKMEKLRALAAAQKPPYAHLLNRGLLLLGAGYWSEAQWIFEQAFQDTFYPRSIAALALAARSAHQAGQPKEAERWRREAETKLTALIDAGNGQLSEVWDPIAIADFILRDQTWRSAAK